MIKFDLPYRTIIIMKNSILTLSFCVLFTLTLSAQSQATYSVVFDSNWSQTAHPHPSGNLPATAHWSRLVGTTHNDQITFLEMGGFATQGVEDIAETGNNTEFFNEVNTAINAGNATTILDGGSLSTALGQIDIMNIVTTEDHPLLTLLSMIAPSPDWMIAVNSIELLDINGIWKDEIVIDLYPYDAGTDSGIDYGSPNSNTNPAEPISSLQGVAPFSSEIIGTLTISLDAVLGTNDTLISTTTLFPNPAQNEVTISNTQLISSVQIYNVLGKEVHLSEYHGNNSVTIDTSQLPSGIYLVSVVNDAGSQTTQRLIKR